MIKNCYLIIGYRYLYNYKVYYYLLFKIVPLIMEKKNILSFNITHILLYITELEIKYYLPSIIIL